MMLIFIFHFFQKMFVLDMMNFAPRLQAVKQVQKPQTQIIFLKRLLDL